MDPQSVEQCLAPGKGLGRSLLKEWTELYSTEGQLRLGLCNQGSQGTAGTGSQGCLDPEVLAPSPWRRRGVGGILHTDAGRTPPRGQGRGGGYKKTREGGSRGRRALDSRSPERMVSHGPWLLFPLRSRWKVFLREREAGPGVCRAPPCAPRALTSLRPLSQLPLVSLPQPGRPGLGDDPRGQDLIGLRIQPWEAGSWASCLPGPADAQLLSSDSGAQGGAGTEPGPPRGAAGPFPP